MKSAVADPWDVTAYEVRMLRATYQVILDQDALSNLPKVLANAVEESAVLHTRILCDIFLSNSGGSDDILISRLFPNWRSNGTYSKLKGLVATLRTGYGTANIPNSPCWIFNKMMAHPTIHRGISYDYTKTLHNLRPTIEDVIGEIESLRGTKFTWSW